MDELTEKGEKAIITQHRQNDSAAYVLSYFQTMKHEAPRIDAKELQTFVEATLPHATVSLSIINPQYQSWSLTINANDLWYEYSWGPLSGFGFTDVNAETGENENPFSPYEAPLPSMADAKQFLLNKIQTVV